MESQPAIRLFRFGIVTINKYTWMDEPDEHLSRSQDSITQDSRMACFPRRMHQSGICNGHY